MNFTHLEITMERSLSQWDCTELARQVIAATIVSSISASTIRRILNSNKLKPWRHPFATS
jgi:hypothetical protein